MAEEIMSATPRETEGHRNAEKTLDPTIVIKSVSNSESLNCVAGLDSEKPSTSQFALYGIRLRPPPGKFVVEILFELAGLVAAVAFGVFAIKSVAIANKGNDYSSQDISQAVIQNQLALLTICLTNGNLSTEIVSICSRVIAGAVTMIPSAASLLFSPLPSLPLATPVSTQTITSYIIATSLVIGGPPEVIAITSIFTTTVPVVPSDSSTPSATPLSKSSRSPISVGAIVGIVVGVVVLVLLGAAISCLSRKKRRRIVNGDSFPTTGAAPPTEEGPIAQQVEASSGGLVSRSEHQGLAGRLRELFVDSKVTNVGM